MVVVVVVEIGLFAADLAEEVAVTDDTLSSKTRIVDIKSRRRKSMEGKKHTKKKKVKI